jgi:Na+/serine symporter
MDETILRPADGSTADDQILFQPGELLLVFATLALVIALALTHIVMGVFLAFIPACLALLLFLIGIERAGTASLDKNRAIGMLLLLTAFCAAVVLGFKACSLSHKLALHSFRSSAAPPEMGEWLKTVITWMIPAVLTALGLARWTDWSRGRRMRWCIVAFAVPPAVIITHQILTNMGGPVTA